MKAAKNLLMKKYKEKIIRGIAMKGLHLVILSDIKSFVDANTWV